MSQRYLHVVAAVIHNPTTHEILIAKRPDNKHQGGKWEFPGGKVEANETPQQALIREINEELGCTVKKMQPLIQIYHHYPDKAVFLDVYTITQFSGVAWGREGQAICWVKPENLNQYTFPAANYSILNAITLPTRCLITGEPTNDIAFLTHLEQALKKGIRLIQFRVKTLEDIQYTQLAKKSIKLCHQFNARIILNNPPLWIDQADGLHLTSYQLSTFKRPDYLTKDKLLSAACHNEVELSLASKLSPTFIFLSPVQITTSHPDAKPLGWQKFKKLITTINCPVYALGGLKERSLKVAQESGAQGVAAISAWWGIR